MTNRRIKMGAVFFGFIVLLQISRAETTKSPDENKFANGPFVSCKLAGENSELLRITQGASGWQAVLKDVEVNSQFESPRFNRLTKTDSDDLSVRSYVGQRFELEIKFPEETGTLNIEVLGKSLEWDQLQCDVEDLAPHPGITATN